MSAMSTLRRAGAVAAAVAAVAVSGTGVAQANHADGQWLYHHSASVVPVLTYGAGQAGVSYGLSRGGSSCCYAVNDIYLGSGHDAIVTYAERPNFATRISATGWNRLARLNNPGHVYVRIVNNGGS